MLLDQLRADLVVAMKNHDEVKKLTIRSLLSAINYDKIDKQRELKDEDVLAVIAREVKKHRESIEMYKKGKRHDLVDKEQKELEILLGYLPRQMSEEEIKKIVKAKSEELKAKGVGLNVGELMKAIMPLLKGKADGQIVKRVVDSILGLGCNL